MNYHSLNPKVFADRTEHCLLIYAIEGNYSYMFTYHVLEEKDYKYVLYFRRVSRKDDIRDTFYLDVPDLGVRNYEEIAKTLLNNNITEIEKKITKKLKGLRLQKLLK
ncbi:hypothetical protein [Guptibacillus spartinae]|uniref:hypothetical protein n=1 Tax=Guptibacillus spartinae TaxID=3025679 RepID=UPI002361EEFE|nr:hypothetical protein [Pseudalkalibacillus spartinae]